MQKPDSLAICINGHSGSQLSGRLRSSVKLESPFEDPIQSVDHNAQEFLGYAKAVGLMHAVK